ncbi:serine/threonine protein kinase [Myxococcus sp. AM011]|uniref:serine/threonine-protein kinase n=1 Tax=Myxococcus sp. AM011 TaxID=2745200 RepID=UPI0015951D40|nr:serine/threonine-protein kinase [Myxococcus sp. AM011]NVJ23714.1 serine/threonine protein kinase [Myxococcus sp. AM011]
MMSSGSRVGAYVIVRRAAVGGSSNVYLARHSDDGTLAAVKMLSATASLEKELVARFLNEARTLQQLQHPFLVKALELGMLSDEGAPFLVLEWLPTSLHEFLRRQGGRLALSDALQVLRQLSGVLHFLHGRGVIHRDLKPENVLLAGEPPDALEVRLVDLGLARLVPEEGAPLPPLHVSTAREALLGTGEYMAPEQWTSPKGVDAKVDVYSLGALGFHLLVGEPPFGSGERSGLNFLHVVRPPPLERLDGLVSEPLRALLGAMLAKQARKRPSMQEVLQALERLVA